VPDIRQTETFSQWLRGLADSRARAKIAARIDRSAIQAMLSRLEKASANCASISDLAIASILPLEAGQW